MAFIVEDGTGVANANSLVAVSVADSYWADRNKTAWAALSTAAKQAALIEASAYVSTSVAWRGARVDADQPLAFPRSDLDELGFTVNDLQHFPSLAGVPTPVQHAVARVAYAVSVDGADLFGTVDGSSAVAKVKAGSVEVQFSESGLSQSLEGRPAFPWLTDTLRGYLNDRGVVSKASRRVARV